MALSDLEGMLWIIVRSSRYWGSPMETITMGQKIAFACVISFVLFLCVTPFIFQESQSKGENTDTRPGRDDALRVVTTR